MDESVCNFIFEIGREIFATGHWRMGHVKSEIEEEGIRAFLHYFLGSEFGEVVGCIVTFQSEFFCSCVREKMPLGSGRAILGKIEAMCGRASGIAGKVEVPLTNLPRSIATVP